ncbi:methylamine utilization protein [Pseudoalteromonas piscicida]|uniref:Methylamine utilization protein n=1 Tax=Pseudoalteromonas piscicida TaxID=43662 RepID=A0AAD0W5D9_PSEO7|nr:methylamine utilization protein [Pseudoalteromonas piscicida]ASD68452.1 methylamine utilization protein [Pseudoalteromonas piscicida]AXQ96736.1 methylamine utilization protein [Pseudoalteromonas piscicida]AXR03501.1 methylamine utilization protein [Pseudoalteromonas piscicida]
MRTSVLFLLSFCFLFLLGSNFATAGQLKVLDGKGEPLQHAVVELTDKPVEPAAQEVAVMDQINKQFVPFILTIQKGQLVNFPNSDDIRHHVYSFSAAKPFELKLYAGTPNQPLKFENSGVVVLGCNIHDSMVGYIYVADDKQVLVSDANGLVTLPDSVQQVTIWHPYQDNDIDTRQTVQIVNTTAPLSVTIKTTYPAPRNTFGERFGQH